MLRLILSEGLKPFFKKYLVFFGQIKQSSRAYPYNQFVIDWIWHS